MMDKKQTYIASVYSLENNKTIALIIDSFEQKNVFSLVRETLGTEYVVRNIIGPIDGVENLSNNL